MKNRKLIAAIAAVTVVSAATGTAALANFGGNSNAEKTVVVSQVKDANDGADAEENAHQERNG